MTKALTRKLHPTAKTGAARSPHDYAIMRLAPRLSRSGMGLAAVVVFPHPTAAVISNHIVPQV
jgi:hypothetical protein